MEGVSCDQPTAACATQKIAGAPMSAIGPKRTYVVALHESAIGGKADISFCGAHVCF